MSYQVKDYIKAQKYYDSCANVMPENYPNNEDIRKKASKLKNLVIAVETVAKEDSLLRLAQMDEKSRKNYIEKVIKNIKSNAEKKQREEAARIRDIQAKQLAAEQNDPSGNKWYWNNVKSKADGVSEFKKIGGIVKMKTIGDVAIKLLLLQTLQIRLNRKQQQTLYRR